MINAWYEAKLFVEHATRIEHGTLHVIVGFMAWLAIALVLRRPLTSLLPLGLTFLLILWNEVVDIMVERWPHPGMQLGEAAIDLALTMFVPVMVMIVARWRPALFAPPPSSAIEAPGRAVEQAVPPDGD